MYIGIIYKFLENIFPLECFTPYIYQNDNQLQRKNIHGSIHVVA